jgi:hypothetical protein
MRKLLLLWFVLILLFSSCNQEQKPIKTETINTIDLFQYKTGNSWIYEVTFFHEDSTLSPTISNDTITVLGDSVIRGNVYKTIRYTQLGSPNITFYRDSSGFLIDNSGKIIFSLINSGLQFNHKTILNGIDTIFSSFDVTDRTLRNVVIPFGNFNAFKKTSFITTHLNNELIRRTANSFYASGIGLISFNKFFLGTKKGDITWNLVKIEF